MDLDDAEKKVHKIYFYFIWFIRITLVIALIFEIINKRWTLFFVTLLTLILSLSLILIEKKYKIYFPPELHLFSVIFIYAGIYLGEVQNFYLKYWWWDSVLHAISGFVLGIIGFGIMYVLFKTHKIKTSPKIIAFLSFCFALAIGALWEIFEFAMDNIFGLNMQKTHIGNGVTDTMFDLILDAFGAIFSSTAAYFYFKKGDSKLYNYLVKYFEKKNPKLFKKKYKNSK